VSERPLAALPEDEKIVLTVLHDAIARDAQPLTIREIQRRHRRRGPRAPG
jgi:hypothetical protein